MQKRGYWLAEYLPISRLIRSAPAQYTRAFVETETDGGATSHRVSHETARSDLRGLAQLGLLVQRRKGRKHIFGPAPDLPTRLKESPA